MSQFIEMFDFHELNFNSPSKDFESICLDDTSSATKIPAAEYLQEGKYAVYDQAQEKDIAGYSNTEQGLCRNYPAVLFGDHSRVVKYINEPFFIGADGVKIIRPRKDNLIPEFLYYDLKYHNIPNTGYNRHFKYIKMISLTKASLEEQSQFLSIAHQADKSGFDGFKSQFIEMFGDTHVKSDNSRQWKEVVEIINGKDYKTIQVEDGGYPVYGTGGEMARAADYLSPANSILLGRKGTIDKPLLIKEKYWNVDTAFGAVPDENILNYVYFYWHCKTIDFNILNKGTTLPSTTKVDLLNLWVKIPAMEEQNRFASIVEQADKSGSVGLKSGLNFAKLLIHR